MKSSKKNSKRLTVRKKNKIMKKAKEHDVAIKKISHSKFKPPKNTNISNMIPNNAPFKIELLDQLEKQCEMQKSKTFFEPKDDPEATDEQQKLTELIAKNEDRQKTFYMNNREFKIVGTVEQDYLSSECIKKWSAHLEKLVEESDLIIQVLDARNPDGTRCQKLEEIISKDPSKKLLLLLNKADYIPKASLTAWISYLRQFHPTLAYCSRKMSIPAETPKPKQKNNKKKPQTKQYVNKYTKLALASSNCLMAALKDLQSNMPQNSQLRTCVIGMPNTGKNEIVISLKRAFGVSKKDIVKNDTNGLFHAVIMPSIILYTTPGYIYSENYSLNDYVMRNLMKISHLSNTSQYGEDIFNFCTKDSLRRNYSLPDFGTYEEFLTLIAKKCGYINKGAIPDASAAAQKLVKNWCDGAIRYFTMPPSKADQNSLLPIDLQLLAMIYEDEEEDELQNFQVNPLESLKIDLVSPVQMDVA